jgi:hypothetical protein
VTLRKHDTNVRSLAVGELGGVTSALSPPGEETSLKRSMTHVAVSDDVVILKLSHKSIASCWTITISRSTR